MPRRARLDCDGQYVHAMNRRVDRSILFPGEQAYRQFASMIAWAQRETRMEITAWALMPNHWHFVLRPEGTRHLSDFMHRLQTVHATEFRRDSKTSGNGCVYGSRFKGFVIPPDRLLRGVVYVERNPVKAGIVRRAEDWAHGSAALSGDGLRSPVVVRLPAELERHRRSLLAQPLPEEFESSFREACMRGVMRSPASERRSAERVAEALRRVDQTRRQRRTVSV